MRESSSGPAPGWLLPALAAVAVFLLLSGCTAIAPSPSPGGQPAVTTPVVASYVVHVPGNNHGVVLLVGRNSCPHCADAKRFLANLSVDYYWVDLDTLDQAQTTEVLSELRFCGQVNMVPILVINNQPPCIIGFNETRIREVLG